MDFITILFLFILFAVFSAIIARSKGRSAFGWFLIGLFFGFFGLLVGLMPAKGSGGAGSLADGNSRLTEASVAESNGTKSCPFCAETIKSQAIVCRFCGKDLPIARASDSELLSAARLGDVPLTRSCLERGVNVDSRNENGATSLFLAAVQGNLELARLLLDYEASRAIPNNSGKTPMEAAREQGFDEIYELLES